MWGCADAASRAPEPETAAGRRSEAIVLVAAEPAGIHPLVSGGPKTTQDLIDRLFLHLFEEQPDFDRGPPTFLPQLASSWDWSEDGRTLRLDLRDDVYWSDGTPVTAADVEFTWRAQTSPEVGWRYAQLKASISGVEVLSPSSLRVDFTHAYPGRLSDLNAGAVLPAHAWRELPLDRWPTEADWFQERLVTNGPFVLESWDPQERIVLAANPDYFEPGLPRLERLVLRVVPLRENRVAMLEAGRADFVEGLTVEEAARIDRAPHAETLSTWHRRYDYIGWNLRRAAFADRDTRVALTLSLDREELVETLWDGQARVGVSPILRSVWAFDPGLEPWPYDVRQATATLRRAGWRREDDRIPWKRKGETLTFELLVNSGNPTHLEAAQLARAHWGRIGIEVEVRPLEFRALLERLDSGDFDAAVGSWGIDTSLDLGYAFHTDAIAEGYNSGGYSSREVDLAIDALKEAESVERRRVLLEELQHQLHDDQPYTFLWEPPRLDGRSRRLRDARPNALSALFRARQWHLVDP